MAVACALGIYRTREAMWEEANAANRRPNMRDHPWKEMKVLESDHSSQSEFPMTRNEMWLVGSLLLEVLLVVVWLLWLQMH